MLSVQAEEVLEQLDKAQNKLFLILVAGFFTGFLSGVLVAWVMTRH